jgi:G3E family GTPase
MRILIVSGFLGAGKTTFIRTLVSRTGRECAILENEYGGANIDGSILSDSLAEDSVNIWEMTEGCICCSMKGDFAASVLTIANAVDPEVLVIEPTGVGMLSNIVENLKQIEYERISLLEPVCLVDGLGADRQLAEYPALFKDQVANAPRILVTKSEHASPEELARIEGLVRDFAPEAEILAEHYSRMDDAWFHALLDTAYDGTVLSPAVDAEPGALPETLTLADASVKNPAELVVFLDDLVRGRFGSVVRAKGYVMCGAEPVRIDVADGRYGIVGADEAGEVVFIGRDIDRQGLRKAVGRKKLNFSVRRNRAR